MISNVRGFRVVPPDAGARGIVLGHARGGGVTKSLLVLGPSSVCPQTVIHPAATYIGLRVSAIAPSPAADGTGVAKLLDGRTVSVPTAKGLFVAGVAPGGPASKADISAGDVILKFDGLSYSNPGLFAAHIHQISPGKTVMLVILRSGKVLDREVTIGETDPGEPFDTGITLGDAAKELWTLLPASRLAHTHLAPSQLSLSGAGLSFFLGKSRYQLNLLGFGGYYFAAINQHARWFVRWTVPASMPSPLPSLVWMDRSEAARFASALNRFVWEF